VVNQRIMTASALLDPICDLLPDCLQQLPHESLHSNSLGLTLKIIEGIPAYASKIGQQPDSIAQAVDARIIQIPR
jgi:hypothetical protein